MASDVYHSFVRARRTALALTAVAAAGLAVAGCGGGGSGSGSLSGMSAKQVVAKAVADLKSAKSFTMDGSVSQSGQTLGVDLGYRGGQGCQGTVTEGTSGSIAIVVIGSTAWIKPSDQFLKAEEGSSAAQVISVLKGRYLKGSTGNSNVKSLTAVCSVDSMTSSFTDTGTLTKGTVTTVDGQQVLPITDNTKGGTMYVTTSATPQVVEISNTTGKGGSTGTINFNVGAQVTLTAPSASQTLDGSAFGF